MAVLATADVLREETTALYGADSVPANLSGTALNCHLNSLETSALCLSGGGIRSASFSLGVIEALASHPRTVANATVASADASLLAKFKYLSTVSGGGYIGGFLSAWLAREHLASPDGWSTVWAKLIGRRATPEAEPAELSWLRSYSNYLTPQLGITSADLWAAIAIFLRNLVLNWFVIIPAICVVILSLKLIALTVGWCSRFDPEIYYPVYISLAIGMVFLFLALRFANRERPTHRTSEAAQGAFLRRDLSPAVLSGICLTLGLAFPGAQTLTHDLLFSGKYISAQGLFWFADGGIVVFALAWIAAWPKYKSVKQFVSDWLLWSISGAVYGALLAVGIYLYFTLSGKGLWLAQPPEVLLLICGVPWVLLSQMAGEMIFVGVSSYQDGSDSDREWLGRAAGWYLAVFVGWLAAMFLVFLGSALAGEAYGQISAWLVGGGAGIVTGFLGKSGMTPAKGSADDKAGISANILLAIAAPILAAALVVGLSAILDQLIFGQPLTANSSFHSYVTRDEVPAWQGGVRILIALVVAFAVAGIASRTININRFSLHALYRNRIVRAFLGASNPGRRTTRNKFTDFDENDNVRMYELWPIDSSNGAVLSVEPTNWRPFHIINIALNIVSTKKLAWQERKAEPFSVSPLHAGSSCLGFRYSATYGDKKGITLGTAVAISGAAASPNMGYHSSPPISFLLTMLNVRLGWWLGNPGEPGDQGDTYKREGPPTAIKPLSYEMLGQTTDDQNYVYLSDGGHFENLALYEMVRRRCRYIVVVDAGCDKDFAFEDLGNAVRKISLDLGVTIRFRGIDSILFRAEAGKVYGPQEPPFHAIGTIDYPAADGGGEPGIILYIKPAFHPRRINNVGIRNYAVAHPEFPHESTSDQWFSESQLESYRALGFEITESILTQALIGQQLPPNPTMGQIFTALSNTIP